MPIKAEVIVRDGPRDLGHYMLDPGEYTIGRDDSCDIVLDSEGISRRHAQIIVTAERLFVRDLDSTNGTFLGENLVEGSMPIIPGAPIRIGTGGSVEVRLVEEKKAAQPNGTDKPPQAASSQSEELRKALAERDLAVKKQAELTVHLTAATHQMGTMEKELARSREMAAKFTRESQTLKSQHGVAIEERTKAAAQVTQLRNELQLC